MPVAPAVQPSSPAAMPQPFIPPQPTGFQGSMMPPTGTGMAYGAATPSFAPPPPPPGSMAIPGAGFLQPPPGAGNAAVVGAVPAAPVVKLPPGVQCPGSYPARARKWDFCKNAKGDPMLHIIFALRVGVDENKEPVYVDFPREKRFSFTESAIDRTYESLGYMGWHGDDLRELIGENSFDLGKVEVEVTLDYGQPYVDEKGRTRQAQPEIAWVNPLGSIRGQKMDADELDDWCANMASMRRSKRGTSSAAARVVAEGAKSHGNAAPDFKADSGDEIPF